MGLELVVVFIFLVLLSLFLYFRRKNIVVQKILFPFFYLILYRSEYGLGLMDSAGKKFRLPLRIFGFVGIIIGFIAMAVISFLMVKTVFDLVFVPKAAAGVAVVVPFDVNVPGFLSVPTLYWIISIFILAVVHEFAHGAMARVHNVHVKSTGFAFFSILIPVIPAAFVEPDEKILRKKSLLQQLSIFAAGAFANLVLAGLLWVLLFFLIIPAISSSAIEMSGVQVVGFSPDSAANASGIPLYSVITGVDDVEIRTIGNLSEYLGAKKPGERVVVYVNSTRYPVVLGGENRSSLGVHLQQSTRISRGFSERYGEFTAKSMLWLAGLLMWLFILNLGIGLFNLLPMGPIDGGRMFFAVLLSAMEEKKAARVFYWVSMFFFALVVSSLLLSFFK